MNLEDWVEDRKIHARKSIQICSLCALMTGEEFVCIASWQKIDRSRNW